MFTQYFFYCIVTITCIYLFDTLVKLRKYFGIDKPREKSKKTKDMKDGE